MTFFLIVIAVVLMVIVMRYQAARDAWREFRTFYRVRWEELRRAARNTSAVVALAVILIVILVLLIRVR